MTPINLIHDPAYQQYVAEFEQFQRAIAALHGVDPNLVRPTNGATGALHALFSITRIAASAPATNRQPQTHERPRALFSTYEYFDAIRLAQLYDFYLDRVPTHMSRYPIQHIMGRVEERSPSVLYISVPNNPTGMLLPQTELAEILRIVPFTTRVILDATLLHPQQYLTVPWLQNVAAEKDIVLVHSFSKSHGLVPDRVGYCVALQRTTADSIHPFAHAPHQQGMQKARALVHDTSMSELLLQRIQASDALLRAWNETQQAAVYYPSASHFACIELQKMSGSVCA